MSTLTKESLAVRVWFDDDNIWVQLDDGRQIGVPLAYYPRLLRGTKEQRLSVELWGKGSILHWESLDEDLSVEGIVLGIPDRTKRQA